MAPKSTLLIVDDEPGPRTFLKEFLTDSGYLVKVAASGREALDLIRSDADNLRLVLTDLAMPGMDGLALLKEAREAQPELDFIIMTAHATVQSAITALRAGASDYLLKPLELDEVLIRVRKALAVRETEARAERLEHENRGLRPFIEDVAKSNALLLH